MYEYNTFRQPWRGLCLDSRPVGGGCSFVAVGTPEGTLNGAVTSYMDAILKAAVIRYIWIK